MNEQRISGNQQEPRFFERVLSHKGVSNVQAPEGGIVFRLLSYNLLAKHNENAVDSFLDGELIRRTLALQEILHWDPDIICAQEVCDFSDLAGMLAEHGYQGAHVPSKFNKKDTCATFWKSSRLVCCSKQEVYYVQQRLKNNVALLVHLGRADAHGQPLEGLVVANTHLLFNAAYGDGAHQLGQLRVLLSRMSQMSQAASCGSVPAPCVLAGDFNAAPGSAVYQLLQEGLLHLNQFDVTNVSGELRSTAQTPLTQQQQPQQQQQQQCQHQQQQPQKHTSQQQQEPDSPDRGNGFGGKGFIDWQDDLARLVLGVCPKSLPPEVGWRDPGGRLAARKQQAKEGLLTARSPIRLQSAYVSVSGQEPEFTQCHNMEFGTVDYIWYTPSSASYQTHIKQVTNASATSESSTLFGGLGAAKLSALPKAGSGAEGESTGGADPAGVASCCHTSQSGQFDPRIRDEKGISSGARSAARSLMPKCCDGDSGEGSTVGAGAQGACDGGDPSMGLAGGLGPGVGAAGSADAGAGAGGPSACGGAAAAAADGGGGGGGDASTGDSNDAAATQEMVTGGLYPLRVLMPPDRSRFPTGMPNPRWPSDHVSLVCDFLLRCSP